MLDLPPKCACGAKLKWQHVDVRAGADGEILPEASFDYADCPKCGMEYTKHGKDEEAVG